MPGGQYSSGQHGRAALAQAPGHDEDVPEAALVSRGQPGWERREHVGRLEQAQAALEQGRGDADVGDQQLSRPLTLWSGMPLTAPSISVSRAAEIIADKPSTNV